MLYLLMLIMVGLTVVRFSDPGIVPYRRDDAEIEFTFWDGVEEDAGFVERKVAGHWVQFPLCNVCQFYKPPGVEHCSLCDNCVIGFRLHSSVMGNCIGACNYGPYVIVVLAAFLESLLIGVSAVAYLRYALVVPLSHTALAVVTAAISLRVGFQLFDAASTHLGLLTTAFRTSGSISPVTRCVGALCNAPPAPIDFQTMTEEESSEEEHSPALDATAALPHPAPAATVQPVPRADLIGASEPAAPPHSPGPMVHSTGSKKTA
ncbi:uncharacterized protein AMSG_08898 [Thecamonas trahens ATCC 50062]|uniref:Palmitoyltransferase n=1 Tax=Thecamonas trahens ATCC 50062 TaxID=461836 RepID=A0A0L0DM44_THETB|nr:hypothetical protein AMSG_08898 [Thecamonas trahens ATCC 50062]KNC53394.1 hypothetical protein AMSG_08898 [Thecamonas trahens ATCC 50062]|eukprot:XP_013754435.1 hypothetical protein AMSG_08898 [Thecamonas trahens ATCC 50062]